MKIVAPVRVARTFTQTLHAPAERVFPLLCPVREADWIEGWDPSLVVTRSGVAEEDCVFVTGQDEDEAVWIVTRYEPEAHELEFIKTTPALTVGRITIRVNPIDDGRCTCDIRYQHTALSAAGEEFVARFTREHFEDFMRTWEKRLNHYLATGEMLTGP